MPRAFRRSDQFTNEFWNGHHKRKHWYVDNSIYFITARCVDRYPAFSSEQAKSVFWDRFNQWTSHYGFVPIVTTLLDNHYHTIGYLKVGSHLAEMMRKVHGSVAKLVNDVLPERRIPFWREAHDTYFDGRLRDELQLRRAYRYVLLQAVRHGVARDWKTYAHTRVNVPYKLSAVETCMFTASVN